MTNATRSPESIFREHGGVLRMSEAVAAGLNRRRLYALRDAGTITQLSRGVYRLASLPELEAPDLVTVAARLPGGVVCLNSALAYHELTTQIPHASSSLHAARRGTAAAEGSRRGAAERTS